MKGLTPEGEKISDIKLYVVYDFSRYIQVGNPTFYYEIIHKDIGYGILTPENKQVYGSSLIMRIDYTRDLKDYLSLKHNNEPIIDLTTIDI